jgi:acetyltransferase-like isoleucine patch superfamily enzyme
MFKRYRLTTQVYLFCCYVITKVLYSPAKLIRFPFDVRGYKFMEFGKNFTTGRNCRLEVENIDHHVKGSKILKIGKNVQINDNCHITAGKSVIIEDNVLIASKVYISDTAHGSYGSRGIHSSPSIPPQQRHLTFQSVLIKKNVWLGDGVCILPGVTIGEGAIIGANSVVTHDIPDFCIAVGVPAKSIKKYNNKLSKWEKI